MTKLLGAQAAAKAAAKGKNRYAWWLEPGMGKTLLALDEFNDLYQMELADIMIVFCPNSLISTWRNEIKKHGFEFNVVAKPYHISQIKPPCVLLYNYESIIAGPGKMIEEILRNRRCYVVFDESTQIKNFRSARWKAINGWRDKITFLRLLSGRPLVQSVLDLWTQGILAGAKFNSSPFAFRNKFAVMGGWMNKQVVGVKNEEELHRLMAEVSFRAEKRDWLDLPEQLYTEREYVLTPAQLKMYREMHAMMVTEFNDQPIAVHMAVHKYAKLQQIGSGIIIDEEGKSHQVEPLETLAKFAVLEEIIEGIESKVIIFAHYKASVESLHKHFGGAVIRGGMKEAEIAENVRLFNETDTKFMVAQSAAAKFGFTLLGMPDIPCHNVVYWENNYQLEARDQSEQRVHRIGQHNPVLYTDLVGTEVDRRIITALQNKEDISNIVMGFLRDASINTWMPA